MSQIVDTSLGRFRAVSDGVRKWWLWQCRCGTWCNLSEAQWNGEVSVDHASHHHQYQTPNAPEGILQFCGYHERHEFAKELVVTIQARAFTRGMTEPMFLEDTKT